MGPDADAFPDAEIELLKPPVTSVNSVTYVDAAGATQTLPGASYSLDAATFPGWLLPAYGTEWPETRDRANAVTIRFTTGYAPTRILCPATCAPGCC